MKHTFSLMGSLFLFQGINAWNIKANIQGKQYSVITNIPVNWFGAWKECNKLNMRSVLFRSEDKFRAWSTMRDYMIILNSSRFWTSGVTSKDGGIFWHDQAEFATHMKWNVGEPGRGNNFCMLLDLNFNFVDTSCDVECSFICERDLHAD